MTAFARNPLIYVWAFLTLITVVSWGMSHEGGSSYQISRMITTAVLLIAAIKVLCVMRYFMEVRLAPAWLKRATSAWVIVVFSLLLGFYWMGL